MKITICGSMRFFAQIAQLQKELEDLGFEVFVPNSEGLGVDYEKLSIRAQIDLKNNFINAHIEKIKKSDAVLIANYDKGDTANYIGANTFLELAFAYILRKKIFVLNDIPGQSNSLEISALKPIVLGSDLNKLRKISF